jgi:hypothetical protein
LPIVTLSGFALSRAISSHRSFSAQQLMIARQQRDRLEVPGEVVLQRIDRAVDDMGAEIAEHDGVAVRCRAHHASGCDAAGGAGDVLDDDRLPKRLPHSFGEDAR